MKHVIIIGAGFAGLNAAKELGNTKDIEVTIIDKGNHHLFQPLLYQVAMAALSPAEIAAPIRSLLSKYKNINVLMETVLEIDKENKTVVCADHQYSFDYLIVACGAKHSYFGNEKWEQFAPGLKSIEQATEIRRRVLMAFEMAEAELDITIQKQYLNFIIVGGGPTGVELAGAIAEMSRFTLAKDFRHIDPQNTRIILIEGNERILSSFSEKMSLRASNDLQKMGVEIKTSSFVTDINVDGVVVDQRRIYSRTVLWAAGVKASGLGKCLDVSLDSQNRVIVNRDLSIENSPDIFVAGDQAHFKDNKNKTLPGVAPVAVQQGLWISKNPKREVKNKKRKDFIYFDKGQMATIGRSHAIVETKGLKIGGFVAWVAWLVIHIYFLTSFKNKFFVILNWAWSYFTFRRGARLIVNKKWKSYD